MTKVTKSKQKAEFGDFQTPVELAKDVCLLLSQRGLRPASILEPTCGLGNFLDAAFEVFSNIRRAVGVDINPDYADAARAVVTRKGNNSVVEVFQGDFFTLNWEEVLQSLPDPLLVVGNPPWVTNAETWQPIEFQPSGEI